MPFLAACASTAPSMAEIPLVPSLPDPARFEAEIQAFERQDSEHFPAPGGVVCIGSSSMRMWHERLAQDLSPLSVIGRGFGGSTWLDVIHFTDRIVLPYRPRAVVIYEGDNDIDFGASADQVFALFEACIARIRHSLPEARLYILATKPCPARWRHWPEIQELNRRVVRACAKDPRLTYIDVATPMLKEDGQPRPEIFLADGIHMNDQGYDLWAEAVRPVVVGAESRYEE